MTAPHFTPLYRAGDYGFVSGQLAFRDGRIEGDVVAQTRQVLHNLEQILVEAGLDLTAVVKTTAWICQTEDFPAFNATYAAIFGDHKPARSTLVSALAVPSALVEIEAVVQL
jgi:2-iminobutanoate/2-iminopropanoate deaminase